MHLWELEKRQVWPNGDMPGPGTSLPRPGPVSSGDNAVFRISLTASPRAGTLSDRSRALDGRIRYFPATGARLPMSKPLVFPALAQFAAATTGRNMTRPAYVAVACGVGMMILLTVDPAYEAAHHGVDTVLWACLAFFVFEWVVRLRHAFARVAAGLTRYPSEAWWTPSRRWPCRLP